MRRVLNPADSLPDGAMKRHNGVRDENRAQTYTMSDSSGISKVAAVRTAEEEGVTFVYESELAVRGYLPEPRGVGGRPGEGE